MKFHCDRCKTRYSIADERVRGKILKIRCKNCSAVITVKEGGQVAPPPNPAAAAAAAKPAGAAQPKAAGLPRPKPAIPSAASKPAAVAAKPAVPTHARGAHPSQSSQPVRMGTNAPTPAARPGAVAQARASFPTRSTATGAQEVAQSGASAKPNSALQGAFAQALKRQPEPGPADSVSNAPATLDAEWYVSEDGEQFGPYELRQAQDWVSSRRLDDELYCWSEGFDDWLPVEKVSHFRGLRMNRPAPPGGSAFAAGEAGSSFDLGDDGQTVVDAPPDQRNYPLVNEDTPIPLFAATMAQIAADAPTEIEEENPFAGALKKRSNGASARSNAPYGGTGGAARKPEPRPALPLPKSGTPNRQPQAAAPVPERIESGNNDFEIGEASRVVKLPPMLGRNVGNAAPVGRSAGSNSGLPGVDAGGLGRGTGTFQQYTNSGLPIIQGGGTIDMPRPEILQPSRRAKSLAVPMAIAGAVLVGVIAILLYLALAGGDDEEDQNLARARLAGDGLAYNFVDNDKDGKDDTTGQTVEEVRAATKGGTARRVIKRNPRETGTAVGRPAGGSEEVDLGGGAGELDPDDLLKVYGDNKIGVSLCYTSALKKDPLLRVGKTEVTIRVGTTGTVSMVSIPSLAGTDLGNCLQKRIKAWRFPKNSSGLNTQFPIVFDN
jgi:predicted Zn finger-like uncharacterized protein